MNIPSDKKVICITGSVWIGGDDAPRHMLTKDGFVRPNWFTTGRPMTDADYRRASSGQFHLASANNEVLAHIKHGGDFVGIMLGDFESAIAAAEQGVLIVGPPEIAAQIAAKIPKAIIFSLKDADMDLSDHLDDAQRNGQLHRVDVDVLEPGAWPEAYRLMMDVMGLPTRADPF